MHWLAKTTSLPSQIYSNAKKLNTEAFNTRYQPTRGRKDNAKSHNSAFYPLSCGFADPPDTNTHSESSNSLIQRSITVHGNQHNIRLSNHKLPSHRQYNNNEHHACRARPILNQQQLHGIISRTFFQSQDRVRRKLRRCLHINQQ